MCILWSSKQTLKIHRFLSKSLTAIDDGYVDDDDDADHDDDDDDHDQDDNDDDDDE